MELVYEQKTIKIVEKSVVPAIKMNFTATLNYNEIPLKLIAQLYSEDKRFLANLEQIDQSSFSGAYKYIPAFNEKELIYHINQRDHYNYEMVALLGKEAIDYIQDMRDKNTKKDVIFHVRATVEYLTSYMNIGSFQEYQIRQDVKAIFHSAPDQERNVDLNILTSPNYLYSSNKYVLPDSVITIPSSDWLHDFQEPLGIGHFMVIEIPDPTPLDENFKNSPDELKTLVERIASSQKIFKAMEKFLNEGEWGKVIEESRKFFELYTKDVKGNIKNLIVKSTGISEVSATKLTTALDNLEDYSNALHHSVEKGGSGPGIPANIFTGGKEDAYLTFNLCASILNLVSKKVVSSL